jgi:hypothetical protein
MDATYVAPFPESERHLRTPRLAKGIIQRQRALNARKFSINGFVDLRTGKDVDAFCFLFWLVEELYSISVVCDPAFTCHLAGTRHLYSLG